MAAPDSFDVVLFGPTGVTGREVARHLHRRAPELGLTWAVAGRDRGRIEDSLALVGAEPADILEVDADDDASVQAMVDRATVVADLVGPYARFGEPVYAACARSGTHLIDACGETDWLRTMIDRYDDAATDSGAVIVPTSGYEALPFDLGALFAAHRLHERTGEAVVDVDAAVAIHTTARMRSMSDVVSGGTYASSVELIRRGSGDELGDPHLLDPDEGRRGGSYDLRPRKHASTGAWLAPLAPSPFLNPPIVHRSAALLRASGDTIHADDFGYREGTVTASMVPAPAAPAVAVFLSGASASLGLAARAPARVREMLATAMAKAGPAPGEGPAVEDLDRFRYRIDIRATGETGGTQDVVVEGEGHPGYKSTPMMLGEGALALADPDAPVPHGAGFLTPATALGLGMLDRLGEAGLTFRDARD